MRTRNFFVSLLCCLGLLALVNSKLTSKYDDYRQSLSSQLKSNSIEQLNDVFYKVKNLVDHEKQTVETIASKDLVCNYLKSISYLRASNTGYASQFNYLWKTFGCPQADLKSEYNILLKASQKGDKLEDIFNAVKLAEYYKEYNGTEVKEACTKVLELVKEDSTTKVSKKSGDSSLVNTARVLEVVEACQSLGLLDTKSKNKLRNVIENILNHARVIGQGVSAFTEGNFFQTTSNLLYYIHKLSPESIKSQDLARFIGYVRNHQGDVETPERNYLFTRLANLFAKIPVATIESNSINLGKDLTLRAKITNLLGEEISTGKTVKVKGNLYGKDSQDTTIAVASDIAFEKRNNGAYEAKLQEKEIKKPGLYQLRLTISDGTSNYDYVENIAFKGFTKVGSLRFGITKSPNTPDSPLEHEVKIGETYNGILSANQGNYIHIEFKVPTGSPKPSLVGARLVNKNYRFASGTVPAKLGREDNMYRIVIDLGDPDHILPYNGQYTLLLILSGEVIETIKWTIANIDLTFIKPAEKPPSSDIDMNILSEIHHQFPGERRKPSFIITTFFDSLVVVALLGFFIVLAKIGVNWDKFPRDFFGSVLSLIFLGLILALLGALTLFWLKINIFETLLLLVLLAIPTVVFGDMALKSIGAEK